MTTTTALSITRAARVGADLIDYWSGLPTPGSMTSRIDYSLARGHHEQVRFMFYGPLGFSELRQWAIGLYAETEGKGSWGIGSDVRDYIETSDGRDFLDAEFERDGVVVQLTSNRAAGALPPEGADEGWKPAALAATRDCEAGEWS